jgi:hypothetical protein
MAQAVCSQPRDAVQTKNRAFRPDSNTLSAVARYNGSECSQPWQRTLGAAAPDLIKLLAADAVDLREVGDAIRAHPELESLVLRLCDLLALSPGVPVSSVEEASIVLGKDRLRIVVHVWSLNRWKGDDRSASQPGIPEEVTEPQENGAAPSVMTEGLLTPLLSAELSAEILGLASLFHWVRRDALSFATSAGEKRAAEAESEPKHAALLTNLLVRDLLSLVSALKHTDLKSEQEAVLQEILQDRS